MFSSLIMMLLDSSLCSRCYINQGNSCNWNSTLPTLLCSVDRSYVPLAPLGLGVGWVWLSNPCGIVLHITEIIQSFVQHLFTHLHTTEHTPQSLSHVFEQLLKFKTYDLRGTPKLFSITSRFCIMSQRDLRKKAQFQDVALSRDNLHLDYCNEEEKN